MTQKGQESGNRALGCAVLCLALAWAAASPAAAQDTTVRGCNERLVGEIGIRELVGDVGDTVAVPVTLHTMNTVDAFGLDLGFPTVLLSFVRLDPGILTPGPCWNIGGNYLSALGAVRLGGSCLNPLPSGSVGTVAVLHFEIVAAGSGDFSSGGYVDDIAGYIPCESVHTTTDIDQDSWGRVKSLYEER